MVGVAVLQDRVRLQPAEHLADGDELLGLQLLAAYDQYRIVGEGLAQERCTVRCDRLGQVDADQFGTERLSQLADLRLTHEVLPDLGPALICKAA